MSTDDIFTQTHTGVPDTDAKATPEWTPLPDYSERPKEKTFSNDSDGLKEAAQSLTEAREEGRVPKIAEDAPIVDRDYHWDAGRGDRVPDHFTLDTKRAAEDLSRVRMAEVEAASPPQEAAQAIDQVRAAWNEPQQTQQQPQPEVQATAEQPVQQPQAQQPPSQEDQLRQILTQHPEVRKAMEVELQQVEEARQAYQTGTWQAAQVSAASLLANYPELAQVPTEHLKTAIAAVAATNPERAMQINAHLERTQALYNASKQAEAAQKQLQMQNMQAWVSAENAEFERTVSSKESPEMMRKIADNVVALAEVPNVQRPGVSVDRDADTGVERAMAKFRSDPSPKSAADLLVARRAATRR